MFDETCWHAHPVPLLWFRDIHGQWHFIEHCDRRRMNGKWQYRAREETEEERFARQEW